MQSFRFIIDPSTARCLTTWQKLWRRSSQTRTSPSAQPAARECAEGGGGGRLLPRGSGGAGEPRHAVHAAVPWTGQQRAWRVLAVVPALAKRPARSPLGFCCCMLHAAAACCRCCCLRCLPGTHMQAGRVPSPPPTWLVSLERMPAVDGVVDASEAAGRVLGRGDLDGRPPVVGGTAAQRGVVAQLRRPARGTRGLVGARGGGGAFDAGRGAGGAQVVASEASAGQLPPALPRSWPPSPRSRSPPPAASCTAQHPAQQQQRGNSLGFADAFTFVIFSSSAAANAGSSCDFSCSRCGPPVAGGGGATSRQSGRSVGVRSGAEREGRRRTPPSGAAPRARRSQPHLLLLECFTVRKLGCDVEALHDVMRSPAAGGKRGQVGVNEAGRGPAGGVQGWGHPTRMRIAGQQRASTHWSG